MPSRVSSAGLKVVVAGSYLILGKPYDVVLYPLLSNEQK